MRPISVVVGVLVALVGSSLALTDAEWLAFKREHGKSYPNSREDSLRRAILAERRRYIERFNANTSQSAGFSLGLGPLTDLTASELQQVTGSGGHPSRPLRPAGNSAAAQSFLERLLGDNNATAPNSVDWRKAKNRVSSVKSQGGLLCFS